MLQSVLKVTEMSVNKHKTQKCHYISKIKISEGPNIVCYTIWHCREMSYKPCLCEMVMTYSCTVMGKRIASEPNKGPFNGSIDQLLWTAQWTNGFIKGGQLLISRISPFGKTVMDVVSFIRMEPTTYLRKRGMSERRAT
jgi:hypothetical protein